MAHIKEEESYKTWGGMCTAEQIKQYGPKAVNRTFWSQTSRQTEDGTLA